MSASHLLSTLEHVRQVREGQWRAKCPAHDGKSTDSLSIGESPDGTVLLRCWGGCDASAVVEAVGLTMADLFPARDLTPREQRAYAYRKKERELLLAIRHELLVLAQCVNARLEGRKIQDPDPATRERLAWQRVCNCWEIINGR